MSLQGGDRWPAAMGRRRQSAAQSEREQRSILLKNSSTALQTTFSGVLYSYCVNKIMALYAPLHSLDEERWVRANDLIGTSNTWLWG